MKTLARFALLQLALLGAFAAKAESFALDVTRDVADVDTIETLAKVRGKSSELISTDRAKSLYWFTNFTVGASPSVRLLVDTGSADVILNNGAYEASRDEKPYGTGHFTASYEGVSRGGFGFETVHGTTHRDIVRSGNLSVTDQVIGNVTHPKPRKGVRPNGVLGFLDAPTSQFNPKAKSWFYNLCKDKSIPECRFGLAFGTSGQGKIIMGTLDEQLIDGDLVRVPAIFGGWGPFSALGDVTLDNKTVFKNQNFVFDSGTDNIQGPVPVVRKMFDTLGYQHHLKVSKNNPYNPGTPFKVLTGLFPCNKPPVLGFSFPAQDKLKPGQNATIFNVSPAVWDVYDHGNNSCTSVLGGSNVQYMPKKHEMGWLIGQAFFAGHYMDFDVDSHTVAIGNLVDPVEARKSSYVDDQPTSHALKMVMRDE